MSEFDGDDMPGTQAPSTYKDIPVPERLNGHWNGPSGYWWRKGIEDADEALQRALEGH